MEKFGGQMREGGGRCASDELWEWELKMEEMVVLMTRLK